MRSEQRIFRAFLALAILAVLAVATDTLADDRTESQKPGGYHPAIADLGNGSLLSAFDTYDNVIKRHHAAVAYLRDGFGIGASRLLPGTASKHSTLPVIDRDEQTGTLFLATRGDRQIQFLRSVDLGRTWKGSSSGSFETIAGATAPPALAVDNFAGPNRGSVYLCWSAPGVGQADGDLRLARSRDGGGTFAPARGVLISRGGSGCAVVVSPNHQVSVFYQRAIGGQSARRVLFTRRSFDGGSTFTPEVVVAGLGAAALASAPRGRDDKLALSAAVDGAANRGFLYVAFERRAEAPSDSSDAYLTYSSNGGATWSEPLRTNDDPAGRHFAPTVAVSGKSLIVTYFSGKRYSAGHVAHFRARLARLAADGRPRFNPSFQLGPNTLLGVDDDQGTSVGAARAAAIDAGKDVFTVVWFDKRQQNADGRYEVSLQSRRILAAPGSTDLRLSTFSSARTLKPGQQTRLSATISATGGPARDVFLSVSRVPGLRLQAVKDGRCTETGGLIDCDLGSVALGSVDRIDLLATGTGSVADAAIPFTLTTSSIDTRLGNERTSQTIRVIDTTAATRGTAGPSNARSASAVSTTAAENTGTASASETVTATLGAIADTYVDQTQANTPHGSDPILVAKNTTGFARHGYVKFDTSSVAGPIESATLRLMVRKNGTSFPDPGSFIVAAFSDNSWSEASTWNTRPSDSALGAVVWREGLPATETHVIEVDVTDFVRAQRDSGYPIVSFTVRSVEARNSGVIVATREGDIHPELALTSTPPPSCVLTATPDVVGLGEETLLSWSTADAISGEVDNGVGPLDPIESGFVRAMPTASTTYTATVKSADGRSATCAVHVDVVKRNIASDPVLVGQTPLNPTPGEPPPIEGIDGPYEMVVDGHYAFVTNERLGSFAVVDVSDPANPTFVTESSRPGINGRGLALSDGYAYITDPVDDSFSIFDVRDPRLPLFVQKLKDSKTLNGPRSIAVSGDHAFVGNGDSDSLVVVDVSNKLAPQIVATVQGPMPGTSLDRVTDVVIADGFAYVASSGAGGLNIVDVRQPAAPVWRSSIACPGGSKPAVYGVKVVGRYAYLACADNASFAVVDVSDADNPFVVGWTQGPEPGTTFLAAFHLYVLGDYAYVTLSKFTGPGGKVVVVDISDPADPRVVGNTSDIREARAVFASGRYLYTASDAWDAVMVFDVGQPSSTSPPTCTLGSNTPIPQGEIATLTWNGAGAEFGSIDNGIGPIAPLTAGSTGVGPELDTTYVASLIDGVGQRGSCATTVEVTPAPGNSLTVAPIADTYVSQVSPGTSYGDADTLITKTASPSTRHAYLKFDTSALDGPIISAKLRMHLLPNDGQFADPGQFSVFEFLDNAWSEATTWNTRPPDAAVGRYLASKTLPITASQTIEIDVTHVIDEQRAAGNPIVSFSARSYGLGGALIGSRESASPPELTLLRSQGAAGPTEAVLQNAFR